MIGIRNAFSAWAVTARACVATLLAACALTAGLAEVATAHPGPRTIEKVHRFDPLKLEAAEDLAIDRRGNVYVTLLHTGEIRKFARNFERNGRMTTFARLPIGPVGLLAGIALDRRGYLYAALNATDSRLTGIWRIPLDGGKPELYGPVPDPLALVNGIAIRRGEVFIADSRLGTIWKVPAGGGPAEAWCEDPALRPLGPGLPFPGPNGIKFWEDGLYVSVSEHFKIYRVPLRGAACGKPQVYLDGIGADNFAFDVRGNMYVTTDPFNTVVRIWRSDRTKQTLATAGDGLDGPAAAAFGTRARERDYLYIANLALFSVLKRPSLMRMHVHIRGKRRP